MKDTKKDIRLEHEEDDSCDLDPSKLCDNCMECLDMETSDYRIVQIDGLITDIDEVEEYTPEDEQPSGSSINSDYNDLLPEYNDSIDIEYIEDLPELKEEYDKKIDALLGREQKSQE